jgi:hypothetical protein
MDSTYRISDKLWNWQRRHSTKTHGFYAPIDSNCHSSSLFLSIHWVSYTAPISKSKKENSSNQKVLQAIWAPQRQGLLADSLPVVRTATLFSSTELPKLFSRIYYVQALRAQLSLLSDSWIPRVYLQKDLCQVVTMVSYLMNWKK